MNLVECVDRVSRGEYSPEDAAVLGKVFKRFLADDRLSINVAFNGQAHKGLRTAVKEHRWRSHIAQAVLLIDHPGATNHSIAVTLNKAFARLRRTQGAPVNPLGEALSKALSAHPKGGTSVNALAVVVDLVRGG